MEYTRDFSALGLEFSLVSNYRDIIEDDEYFLGDGGHLHSLLSNFHRLRPLDSPSEDSRFQVVLDDRETRGGGLEFHREGREYRFSGPIRHLEESAADKRASIFGNMGIFSKILVRELETAGIFSFHSTSFFVPGTDRLILVLGGSGAGKSTVVLRALLEGLQIFGTELTHIRMRDGEVEFLKGSLWQNCRMGNLVEDFPSLLDTFGITELPEGNPWKQYRSVDMGPWQYPGDTAVQPRVTVLFPRIESERSMPERYELDPGGTVYGLYENLADKVSPPSHVYRKFFIPSLDEGPDQVRRMEAARAFLESANLESVRKVLTNPNECLETII